MKKKLLSAVVAASMLALAACGGSGQTQEASSTAAPSDTAAAGETTGETAEASEESAEGAATDIASRDTLNIALADEIVSLDPAYSFDNLTNQVVNQITQGLLYFDYNGQLQPQLCSSWEAVDPLTYVYQIRDDVNFSDGTPMTMDDVLFSLNRHMDEDVASYLAWMYANVESIEQTGSGFDHVVVGNRTKTYSFRYGDMVDTVYETERYFLLFIGWRNGYILEKSGIEGGDVDGLRAFLEEKLNQPVVWMDMDEKQEARHGA